MPILIARINCKAWQANHELRRISSHFFIYTSFLCLAQLVNLSHHFNGILILAATPNDSERCLYLRFPVRLFRLRLSMRAKLMKSTLFVVTRFPLLCIFFSR